MLIMMLAIVGVMIIFSVVGSRRERKKRAQMLGSIKKHDKVVTAGGIVGSVVEFKDDTVVLKVDEQTNTRITVSKSSISQVVAGSAAE
jgi:preprotein translocase subunit YajC